MDVIGILAAAAAALGLGDDFTTPVESVLRELNLLPGERES